MAVVPNLSTRRSSSNSSTRPHYLGRGGAGNTISSSAIIDDHDLETPTLKGAFYTTGRGGSGNITKNSDPVEARRAQDVGCEPRRFSSSSQHIGRGGAANVFRPNPIEVAAINRENARRKSSLEREQLATFRQLAWDQPKGLADRGKEWILSRVGKA